MLEITAKPRRNKKKAKDQPEIATAQENISSTTGYSFLKYYLFFKPKLPIDTEVIKV